MPWFHPKTLLDKTFEIGIILKGIDGVLELIGALLLLIIKPHLDAIMSFLTQRELGEDPHDFIATHLLNYGHRLEHASTVFAVLFLLTHGITKVILVVSLLREKLWAYPFALITLGIFIIYQAVEIIVKPTVSMTLLTLFDALIIWLVWREWQHVKVHGTKPFGRRKETSDGDPA